MQAHTLLEWYAEAGVDEAVDDTPTHYFALKAKPAAHAGAKPGVIAEPADISALPPPAVGAAPQVVVPLHYTPSAAMAAARELADRAQSIEELEAMVRSFDGCALKKTASKTVFGDGNPKGRLMVIGEAPGAQEDVQGIPFCGASGKLLDAMLAAIGLSRQDVFISNTVFWRPPGNRQPSLEETQTCLPFVEKLIRLVNPQLLLLAGGTATTTLLKRDTSVTKLRGRLDHYVNPYLTESSVPVLVTFHPSYLLRSPAQKRLAWHDMLMVKACLQAAAATSAPHSDALADAPETTH
jgi:uracil-DNA glycosylase